MKIIAFAGSNSEHSINKKLAEYVTTFFNDAETEILDLNDFEMPIYKQQREVKDGVPQLAHDFAAKLDSADLIVLSLAEHNGTYTTAFKNIFDWVSRIPNRTVWNEIPLFLLSTAPGQRGGQGVMDAAVARFPYHGGNIVETFSLPFVGENFDLQNNKISNADKEKELKEKIAKVQKLEALLTN